MANRETTPVDASDSLDTTNMEELTMSQSAEKEAAPARTPGAKRAGPGEHLFELAKVNHMLGGPDYSTANGSCVEGDRIIVALMRMPAGTGAEPHYHPNEQWIYVLEGCLEGRVGGETIKAAPGSLIYIPANAVHSLKATQANDVVFFTAKDATHNLFGIKK